MQNYPKSSLQWLVYAMHKGYLVTPLLAVWQPQSHHHNFAGHNENQNAYTVHQYACHGQKPVLLVLLALVVRY